MAEVEKPQKGDKVSWNWGAGAPAGTVAETQEQGSVEIKTHRGNTIKRKGEPGNPAVRIERSGNDVVKKSSELTVEERGDEEGGQQQQGRQEGGGGGNGKKRGSDAVEEEEEESEVSEEDEDDDEVGDMVTGGKGEGLTTRSAKGKEVKRGGKEANKKQKTEEDEEARKQEEDEHSASEYSDADADADADISGIERAKREDGVEEIEDVDLDAAVEDDERYR
ncbi:uncharacterized protein GGS25DRAFT_528287 [Hypoxylon fragiforme]|uniref:uncharacterized protein n=1 Tax=Hypoxylon fragiforme TaxID=63214 RepID=UPI0020C669A1|nr:uncharacterized protein GGS25DRAFT_528287 [Hypoxylon fragiforme]KAI2603257.1 hypothetical protein GGS25DRAFT_528287 [Hypoxylon fragiforme]